MKDRQKLIILLITTILIACLFIFLGLNERNFDYAFVRRVKKVFAISLTAFAIGISSLIFQTITNNRILTPSVIGLDSLYMLIQTALIFFLGNSLTSISKYQDFLINITCLIIFSLLLYKFILSKATNNIFLLVLVGMICGSFFGSLTGFMQAVIDPNEFDILQGKMFASFNAINFNLLVISTIIFTLLITYVFINNKKLDVLCLGFDNAKSLGLNVEREIFIYLSIIVVFVAIATALIGPITFLGIITTNISYQLFATFRHKTLIIANALIGALFLLFGQLIIERIFQFEITTSIVINLVGGIYFIYLMLKMRTK